MDIRDSMARFAKIGPFRMLAQYSSVREALVGLRHRLDDARSTFVVRIGRCCVWVL